MAERPYNVLFLCTGNSARSILAGSLINYWGRGKFVGFSAGSPPKGTVHPIAMELLRQMKMPANGKRQQSCMSSPSQARRNSISSSPSATTLLANVFRLAGVANDRALGRGRSRGSRRKRDGQVARVPLRVSRAGGADQDFHQPAHPVSDRVKLQERLHLIGKTSAADEVA